MRAEDLGSSRELPPRFAREPRRSADGLPWSAGQPPRDPRLPPPEADGCRRSPGVPELFPRHLPREADGSPRQLGYPPREAGHARAGAGGSPSEADRLLRGANHPISEMDRPFRRANLPLRGANRPPRQANLPLPGARDAHPDRGRGQTGFRCMRPRYNQRPQQVLTKGENDEEETRQAAASSGNVAGSHRREPAGAPGGCWRQFHHHIREYVDGLRPHARKLRRLSRVLTSPHISRETTGSWRGSPVGPPRLFGLSLSGIEGRWGDIRRGPDLAILTTLPETAPHEPPPGG